MVQFKAIFIGSDNEKCFGSLTLNKEYFVYGTKTSILRKFFYIKDNNDILSFQPSSFFKTQKDIRKEKLSQLI